MPVEARGILIKVARVGRTPGVIDDDGPVHFPIPATAADAAAC